MSRSLKVLLWCLVFSLSISFRVAPGVWDISKDDPTIWIKNCSNNANLTIESNDLEGDDPLAGLGGLTYNQVMQSVIDDFNNIPTSFLRLAHYPTDPNNPGAPAAGDSAFTVEKAETRTIEVCFGETDPAAGIAGGYAKPTYRGTQLIRCEVRARPEHAKKAKFLTHLLTHELGHCFGLMHSQEVTQSVMSYFGNGIPRLKNDDYSGITFRYPDESSYGNEAYTLGLTGCSPK